jgi:hypothetical protein
MDCDKLRGIVKKRHDATRDALIRLIKRVAPLAVVRAEPTVEGHMERPDILIHLPGSTKYIDVSFVNPSAPSELATRRTYVEVDAANKYREHTKVTKYQQWTQEVIPFVLETTGRFGPRAKQFFDQVTANGGRFRSSFTQEVQAITAYYNGLIFTYMIDGLKMANNNGQLTALNVV